ncbi:MAG: lipopolysaccharide kinase InaA family protein [Methylophilaceae bacterium]|nr:lipopolysaccharide kinase InaA family protein [Methylophilaceae bacterium]
MMLDLMALSRTGGTDFRLPLAKGGELECLEIVRRIPGQRIVCRGLWNGQAVYAKLFIGNGASRHAARDARGARALASQGIATPLLLHAGAIEGQPGQALIFAAIPDSRNAEQAWAVADDAQRRRLAAALVDVVAQHHAAGLIQTDLYLRNFLCTENTLYTLDGDGIRVHATAIPWSRALPNLALLLSKFAMEDDTEIPSLLRVYAARRGWAVTAGMQAALIAKTAAIRIANARRYARKVLRNCTEVQVIQDSSRFMAVRRDRCDATLSQILDDPDGWLERPDCVRLKNGNTCTVGLVSSGGCKIVIKRYNVKSLRHGLSRLARRTRASLSWSNAHLLGMLGIATAPPLALIERRWGPLRRESYYLSEYVEGQDIGQVLADPATPEHRKQEIAARTATLLHKLYRLGICHGDLKTDNLKLAGDQLLLLDLDALRLHRHGPWFERRHARDLKRLLKNWSHDPAIRHLLSAHIRQAYGPHPVLTLAGIANL